MKYLLILFVLLQTPMLAQDYGSSLDFGIGAVQNGFGAEISYNYSFSERDVINGSAIASFSTDSVDDIDLFYNIYRLRGGYLRQITSTRRGGVKIHLGGGLLVGYEDVNLKEDVFFDEIEIGVDSNFIFGAHVSGEVDFYISRTSSIIIKITEEFHLNSDLGNFIPYAGISYRHLL